MKRSECLKRSKNKQMLKMKIKMKYFLMNQKKGTKEMYLQMRQRKQTSRAVNRVLMTEIMQLISWRLEVLVWREREGRKLLSLLKTLLKIKKISRAISKRKREKLTIKKILLIRLVRKSLMKYLRNKLMYLSKIRSLSKMMFKFYSK